MVEQALVGRPDVLIDEGGLMETDFTVLQCIVDGWTSREMRSLHFDPFGEFDPDKAKTQIARKMFNDDSLDMFLGTVRRLPFTPEYLLGKRESMALFLHDANFIKVEIGRIMGIDRGAASNHVESAELKKKQRKDRNVPKVKKLNDHREGVGLIRGIYVALCDGQINKQTLESEPKAMLSYNESRVLFLMCAGMTFGEIAKTLHRSVGTVDTYNRRIGAKLGVTKKYPMIAKGLVEMMREQKKNNPEQGDCFYEQEGV